MKQIEVICDVAIDNEIRSILAECGIVEYTRFPRCAGSGHRTGTREDDHVWPGYNVATIAVVDDSVAFSALARLQAYRDDPAHAKSGLFAFITPVEAMLK